MAKLKPIGEQVMVVAGASSGIGLATALRAAEKGAKVLLVSRNETALAGACERIRAEGGEADYAIADVGEKADVERAAAKAIERFGRIDTWAHVAGVSIFARLLETPRDEHQQLFRTNYWGVVNAAEVAIPHLRERGGAFIVVGSIGSDMGSPILGAYAATKHAAKGYLDSLRIELKADDAPVEITLIKPAGIGTPLPRNAANHMDGEAKLPPPVYAPELVADAIISAAERPTRELVVGGSGQMQLLLATHWPGLFDRMSAKAIPEMRDPGKPPTASNNLFAPADGGEVGSAEQPGRNWSVYTAARLHPRASLAASLVAGAALVAGGRALAAYRRRPSAERASLGVHSSRTQAA